MADNTTTPVQEPEETEIARPPSRRRGILVVVIAAAVLIALGIWWRSTYYENTDDAQISGNLVQISTRVAGHVAKIYVVENQKIKRGAPILDLDPSDYQVAVEQAQAALASAKAAAAAAKVFVPITSINTGSNLRSAQADLASAHASVSQAEQQLDAAKARVAQADANNFKAQSDLQRYKPLVERDVISKQQYDAALAAANASQASLNDAQASEKAAEDGVRVARERVTQAQASESYAKTGPQQVEQESARAKQAMAQVEQAQSQLDQAELNLSYTHIVAPTDGIITRKSVQISENVTAGQNLMTLVDLDGLWVTANFKETQLQDVRDGQKVTIHVDATNKDYAGRVTQIGGATGSVLSLFPPENATGNFVKVVQRIPVRIDFTNIANEDPDQDLRPGMSLEPKVWVK